MRAIQWGVIGSGGIARRRTIPEGLVPAGNAELVCVHDINPDVNTDVAAQFNTTPAASIPELLAEDIDAVYVASPAHLHVPQVKACAAAGKHVLCEKPLGLRVEEVEELLSECRARGVTLGTGFMMRFHSRHQAALRLIREGRLGKPVYGRAQLSCWFPPMPGAWRQDPGLAGGGALMDMGSHCLDLLEMFLGRVIRLSCFTNHSVHAYASEDSAVVTLEFENGAMGTVDTFFCVPDNACKNRLELYGSKGSILAQSTLGQGESGRMTAFLEEGSGKGYQADQVRTSREGFDVDSEPLNIYRAEIEEFSQALLEQRVPANHAEIGLRSQKVLAACYTSARTGCAVAIE